MVELKNIRVVYNKNQTNEKKALDGLNLTIKKGEYVTIIGPNGAGKTTLLKILTGEIHPEEGDYVLNGRDIKHPKPYKLFRNVGIVYQEPDRGVFPDLTIEENLILGSKKGNRFFSFGKYQGLELLKSLNMGLEDRLKTKVKELSGGQKQALAMILAAITYPDLLLLDEHTAALDPKNVEKVMELTLKINTEMGLTILMVTHNMKIVEKYAKRIVEIKEGIVTRDFMYERPQSQVGTDRIRASL
ncbi:MAG TPA: ATP-binding cassette domain-containing protein [Defluviitoga sp.]|nr:ATP-binding cassette domain-containing protein [Defluviitoga sp.]HOP23872.1 ATP-binding cassette domain-containing protein [Defluviitoga sp.]HPZ28382.1 ATP-binding cassette domain-containing protein [Defluviitoga sp.]HQD62480.1 ATP-binding cassette domain-containing protein [Defluviitoga sp.]